MFIACPLPDTVRDDLASEFDVTGAAPTFPSDAEVLEALPGKQVLFAAVHTKMSAAFIAALPQSIKAVATYSVGHDHVDLEAARARGLAVFYTPDVLTPSVAENAMFLMLGAARRGNESIALVRSGKWPGWSPRQLNGQELWRKTLGVFGMGRIGRAIAQRARGFEMAIHYSNRSRLPPELEQGATFHSDPEQMLRVADVVMLASPSTPETRAFLDERRTQLLKPNAIVVNIGRGDLVVDDALIGALARGDIQAAGLDVFNNEPRLDPRYFELPNVFMLPHIGSSTVEARLRMGVAIREGIVAWRNGRQPANRLA
jgi:glyoxylate reductase